MRRWFVLCLILLTFGVGVWARAPVVYVIPIEGTIEPGLAGFVQRIIRQAEKEGAAAVLLEIDTFGGRVDGAVEIKDAMLASRVPVITFVRSRALSAGALLTIAGEIAAMTPGSTIGAAETRPAEEKVISAFRAEFRGTAQARGRDPRIAEAMVDSDLVIPGLTERGKILTLDSQEALDLGFIEMVVADRGELLQALGYGQAQVVVTRATWAENLARFLTHPVVSSVLLVIGFVGLIFEILTAGWGIGGTIGLTAMILFFGGRFFTGLAGWEHIILFIAGLVLLAIEAFALPGFGIAGAGGIISILLSIYLSLSGSPYAPYIMLGSLVSTVVIVTLLFKYLGAKGVWSRFVLSRREGKEEGYVSSTTDYSGLMGKEGVTITVLRPTGRAEIEGEPVEVVSEGGYIAAHQLVRVVKVDGIRVVVRQQEDL